MNALLRNLEIQYPCPAVALARSHYYVVGVRSHDTNLSCVFCCPTIMSGGADDHTCLHTDLDKVSESQVNGRRRKLVSIQTLSVLFE